VSPSVCLALAAGHGLPYSTEIDRLMAVRLDGMDQADMT
jgi:hypothetical protein